MDNPRVMSDVTDLSTGAVYDYVPDDGISFTQITRAQHLATGSQAEVFLMIHNKIPNLLTAAKVSHFGRGKRGQKSNRRYFQEVAILQQINHVHIIQGMYSVVCESYGVLMMDYYPQGDLLRNLFSLEDQKVEDFFVQIACAVRHIHSKRIVHRDIRLENILVKNGYVVLTDFGEAEKLKANSSMVTGHVGDAAFMAPEVRSASARTKYNGFKADSFAVGVCLYSMMLKDEPDKETDYLDAVRIHNKHIGLDKILLKSVRRLLTLEAKDRWDVTRMLSEFKRCDYHKAEINMFS